MSNIANVYNQFQNHFGTRVEEDHEWAIEHIFSENFKKVVSGQVCAEGRAGLLKQLTELREAVDGWRIEEIQIIEPANGYNYVLEWKVHTGNAGIFHALAVLGSTDGIIIDSINEFAYKVEE